MPYKKYIKRGGKIYGPYIYHSKRVDGKVVSEYHGAHTKKFDYNKFLWMGLVILVIAILFFGVSFLGNRISGQATFDVKVDYTEGETIDGVLKLSLKEGELLPASSKLVFENNEEKYEYLLAEILSDKTVEGNFYIKGKEVSGSGSGYGIEGTKEVYPTVYFTLEVYLSQKTKGKPIKESVEEEVVEEPIQEEPIEEEVIEESKITGEVVSFFFGWMSTGRIVMELQTEVDGQVSVNNPFTYLLDEGETAEVKPKSVRTSLEDLSDNVIDFKIEGNEVVVTTDYSEEEKGFGEDYLKENIKSFEVDLSALDLMLDEGDLKISLIYSEEELVSLTTILQEGETSETQLEEVEEVEEVIEEVEEILEQEVIVVGSGINLTEKEKAILLKEFNSIGIVTIREEVYNGRLIIGSQLRDYKIEHSYEYPQDLEGLKIQIEADRTRWLKDIAATLSRKKSIPQKVNVIEDSTPLINISN